MCLVVGSIRPWVSILVSRTHFFYFFFFCIFIRPDIPIWFFSLFCSFSFYHLLFEADIHLTWFLDHQILFIYVVSSNVSRLNHHSIAQNRGILCIGIGAPQRCWPMSPVNINLIFWPILLRCRCVRAHHYIFMIFGCHISLLHKINVCIQIYVDVVFIVVVVEWWPTVICAKTSQTM